MPSLLTLKITKYNLIIWKGTQEKRELLQISGLQRLWKAPRVSMLLGGLSVEMSLRFVLVNLANLPEERH